MMENKPSLRWIIGGILAVSLISYTITQEGEIREQARKILDYEERVTSLESMLSTETTANQQLRLENESLEQQNKLLRDSVAILEHAVVSLQKKLANNAATIKGIKDELKRKEKELASLKAELVSLKHQSSPVAVEHEKKIAVNIAEVESQQEQLKEMQKEEEVAMDENSEESMRKELEMRNKKHLTDILENTKVTYKTIQCKKLRASDPLKKIDEDGSNWVYTTLKFNLENSVPNTLNDEYFEIKIVDADTGEELSYIESNPAYAKTENGTKGLGFQWRKNPIELVYINMQAKTGVNYDLKIYYKDDEKKYLLFSSVKPLIRKGKIVAN